MIWIFSFYSTNLHTPFGKVLCYTRNILFASDKSKVYYYKFITTTGKFQRFIGKNFNTLTVALNSSKAVLIIVMKQISKRNCKENLSLEVMHYLLLYFTLIFHYIAFSTLSSTWLSFAINMKRNVLLLCCHIF